MTKKPLPNPQPTNDVGSDIYMAPRSKTPAKQAIYDRLFAEGWRFDAVYGEWWTPEAAPIERHGRLECAPDFLWFRIQSQSRVEGGHPVRGDAIYEVNLNTEGMVDGHRR